MLREYHKWHSSSLHKDMEILQYGHSGARVIVFPTSQGRYYDWENRGLINTLGHHISEGWLQIFCVDSVDPESWFNRHVGTHERTHRHLQYQEYVINEVLPFTLSKNDNPYAIATGASFGAYHSASIALRYPEHFQRVLAMSGVYDVRDWTDNYMDDTIREGSPCEYIAALHDHEKLERIRKIDWIIPIGKEDSLFDNNQWFSQLLWEKGVWHGLKVWDGNAHDWPHWHQMIVQYIGGDN